MVGWGKIAGCRASARSKLCPIDRPEHMLCLPMRSLVPLICATFVAAPLTAAAGVRTWLGKDGVLHVTNGHADERETVTLRNGVSGPLGDARPYLEIVAGAAETYRLPQALLLAVIAAESNFQTDVVSRTGALGLMQLMPETARIVFVENRSDPVQNIYGGARYLRYLTNTFGGDVVKVVAAYNAGPEAVRRAKGIPAFGETREYVRRVIRLYRLYQQATQGRRNPA